MLTCYLVYVTLLWISIGGEVVVGPAPVVKGSRHIPSEILIERQKLRPGSGVLNVKVVTDGPTRVLQITDINDVVSEVTNNSHYQRYQWVGNWDINDVTF